MLGIKNEYADFCVDETAVYLYLKWEASEKSYNENWKEQSENLDRKIAKQNKKKSQKVK